MGRVDQGFVTLWAARHLWGSELSYQGFGGTGLQVRDVLHVDDLSELIALQCAQLTSWSGRVVNVGGGSSASVSLAELTAKCSERAGRRLTLHRVPATSPADIPYYVSDNRQVSYLSEWTPSRSFDTLLDDTFEWLRADEARLRSVLA
jgi:CDP-paratose 2-epimerase